MRIAVLVFDGVQMLDAMGPIDIFNEAITQSGRKRVYSFELISIKKGPVTASNGVQFVPHATLATASASIDTLIIAGSPHIHEQAHNEHLLAWLRKRGPKVRRLGSVCAGAFLLAHAGLLDGRRATTHWNMSARLAREFPKIQMEEDHIFVRDGSVYTSAGVTAGMDLALAMVEEDFGREVALKVARQLVMFVKRPGGQSQFSAHLAAQVAGRTVIRDVQAWVLANVGAELGVDQLAAHANMSVRSFSRLFKEETGSTPADFVEAARIDAARLLLEDSTIPLKRVADRAGFGDANALRRAFHRRLGVTPTDYRSRFN